MTKRIGLLLLSLFAILGSGVSFANPIDIDYLDICTMFENVEIDNYRVVVQNGSGFYIPITNTCSECRHSTEWRRGDITPKQKVFLLNKTIQLDNITEEIIESNAILIGSIFTMYCGELPDKTEIYQVIHSGSNYALLDTTEQYKSKQEQIAHSGSNYALLDTTEQYKINQDQDRIMRNYIKKFPNYWLLAVIVETLTLFLIAKFCRKSWSFKNRKIIITGILASTVTLPLLRFVLPIFLTNLRFYVILGEVLVIAIETFIIKYSLKIERKMAIFASIVCNLCSFIIGLFIF